MGDTMYSQKVYHSTALKLGFYDTMEGSRGRSRWKEKTGGEVVMVWLRTMADWVWPTILIVQLTNINGGSGQYPRICGSSGRNAQRE